jgi:uncharacterized protein
MSSHNNRSALFLHGFGSSPNAPKALFLKDKFKQNGVDLVVPDLNMPSFEEVTATAMINTLTGVLKDCTDQTIAIASSFATIPLLNAIQLKKPYTQKINKIILLTPCFNYKKSSAIPKDSEDFFKKWKSNGYTLFPHQDYVDGAKLLYSFVEDMKQYDTESIVLDRPTLAFHGTADNVVNIHDVKEYLSKQEQAKLILVRDGDHVLPDQMNFIWHKAQSFIFNS